MGRAARCGASAQLGEMVIAMTDDERRAEAWANTLAQAHVHSAKRDDDAARLAQTQLRTALAEYERPDTPDERLAKQRAAQPPPREYKIDTMPTPWLVITDARAAEIVTKALAAFA